MGSEEEPREMTEEEIRNITERRESSLIRKIFVLLVSIILLAAILSPALMFVLLGFEEAIVAFCVVLLTLLAQSV